MKLTTTAVVFASILAVSGCGNDAQETGATKPSAAESTQAAKQPPALPAELFLATAPANAVPLSEARAKAKAGETITFTGYVGGRAEPFTEGRALFVVADSAKAPACTDGCKIPWDACCVAQETITANSATVQVADADGQTLRTSLNGQNGLAPGSIVTIVGKVREVGEAVLIVDASGILVGTAQP